MRKIAVPFAGAAPTPRATNLPARRLLSFLLFTLVATLGLMADAGAATVALDPTFDGDGKATTDVSPNAMDNARAIVRQADGKYVAAGVGNYSNPSGGQNMQLLRYNSNGTLDTTFANGGKPFIAFPSSLPFLPSVDTANALLKIPGGFVAGGAANDPAGGTSSDFGLAFFDDDGNPGDAIKMDFSGRADTMNAMALQRIGMVDKIIAAGASLSGSTASSSNFALARYELNGDLDTTFGTDGKVTLDFQGLNDDARAVIVLADKKILVAGLTSHLDSGTGSSQTDFGLARFNADGSVDTSFGTNGRVVLDFGAFEIAHAMTLQDGKILLAGQMGTGNASENIDFALARFNADGSLDASFGIAGKLITDFEGGPDVAQSVQVKHGRIVAIGSATHPQVGQTPASQANFALAVYDANGTLDGTVGTGGKITTDFNGWDEGSYTSLIDGDNLVAAGLAMSGAPGTASPTLKYDFAFARYALTFPTPNVANPLAHDTVQAGNVWNYVVPANTFSDPESDPLAYSAALADGSPLPAWMAFDGGTRTFSGTPALVDSGVYDIKVIASDGTGSIFDVFQLSVTELGSLVVTTDTDFEINTDGVTSLREAIAYAHSISANPGVETVSFAIPGGGPHTIILASPLDITVELNINGPSNEKVTVEGLGSTSLFTNSAQTNIANLTLSGGAAGAEGGAMRNGLSGALALTRCTLMGNTASNRGGAIFNAGTLTLTNCTLTSNFADQGGAIYNTGTATITNCTISGNSDNQGQGVIYYEGTLNLKNSIVANNSANLGGAGTLNDGGGNLTSGDPKLAGLQDNGGPTATMALLDGSPAEGIGVSSGAPAADQRGVARPQGSGLDSGAYEARRNNLACLVRTPELTPIVGATITLTSLADGTEQTATTNENGTVGFTSIVEGYYQVVASKTDYSFSPDTQFIQLRSTPRSLNFVGTPPGYKLSGRIMTSSGAAISGVSVKLDNGPTVTTNSAGYYIFNYVVDGEHTLVPVKSGYIFSPPGKTVMVSGGELPGQNFIGSTGYSVSGRVYTSTGTGVAGVAIQLDGGTTVTTNSAGYYTLNNVADGSHSLTASKTGLTFTLSPLTVSVSGNNVTNKNFVVANTGVTVSGRVATSSGAAISGVTVTLDGGTAATTNSAGYYTFTGVANGQHTIVPTKAGYSFVPNPKTVNVGGANLPNQNITGTPIS